MQGHPEDEVPIHYDGINYKSYALLGAVTDPNSSQKIANSGFDGVVEHQGNAGGTHLETMHQHIVESLDPSAATQPPRVSRKPKTSYNSCPEQPCQWSHTNGSVCGQPISCSSVPEHFKEVHRIVGIRKDVEVPCLWARCFQGTVRRSNFVRHIRGGRDSHLGHKRDGINHYN